VDRWTIGSLLDTAAGYLRGRGSTSPRLDAELLLAETLGLERIHLYTGYDRPLTAGEVGQYRELVARRARHEPVAYILGHTYFHRLRLEVTPAVLIPRPETEELVEVALHMLRVRPTWEALPAGPNVPARATAIADVGTGTGAIALSLARETGLRVLATDAIADALAVASRNCEASGLASLVELRRADLLSGVAECSLRLVISNPPYVSSAEMGNLAPDVRLYEPAWALEAGPDGLAFFRRLLPQAAVVLKPGGSVLLEVGEGQAEAVAGLAREAGFCLISIHKDLSGKQRIVAATLPGAATSDIGALDAVQMAALAAALEAGAVIGVPTDTVYGLGARWDSPAGVRRLMAAKGRGAERPLAVLFSSVSAAVEALPDLDARCATVLAALLPGPFTFVVATSSLRPPLVGTADSLGVRVPDHPALLRLLVALGTALVASSANLTGQEDPSTLADVDGTLLAHCAIAFASPEAGPSADPVRGLGDGPEGAAGSTRGPTRAASTVVDLRPLVDGGAPVVLREGAVPGMEVLERIAALF
jgi:release factor glutamine methyltransferase